MPENDRSYGDPCSEQRPHCFFKGSVFKSFFSCHFVSEEIVRYPDLDDVDYLLLLKVHKDVRLVIPDMGVVRYRMVVEHDYFLRGELIRPSNSAKFFKEQVKQDPCHPVVPVLFNG